MQKTSKYAVGLAMYSNRIANFEYGNTENAHAWHTADGMLYLYNRDFNQFGEGYWTTVDPYRLPGTTVDTAPLADVPSLLLEVLSHGSVVQQMGSWQA